MAAPTASQAPRLRDEDRAACAEAAGAPTRTPARRGAVAELVAAERRRRAQQRRPSGRRVIEVPLQRLHDRGQPDRSRSPGAPARRTARAAAKSRIAADRVAPAQQRPRHRGAADSLGEDLGRRVEPGGHAGRDRGASGCAGRRGRPAGRDHPGQARSGDRPARAPRWRVARGPGSPARPPRRRSTGSATGIALDLLVEVDEGRLVAARQAAPDGALAAPRQPDEDEVHGRPLVVPARPGGSRSARRARDRGPGLAGVTRQRGSGGRVIRSR